MDATTALRALRRGWFFALIGALAAVAASAVLTLSAEPAYEASSTYIVTPAASDSPFDPAEGARTLDDSRARAIVSTFVEILSSRSIHDRAGATLGMAPATVDAYDVRGVVLPEANVVELSVTGPNPEVAAALSGAIGAAGTETFVALYRIYDVAPLDVAEVPAEPAGRGPVTTLALAGVLGLAAGAAVGMLWGLARQQKSRTLERRLASYGRELHAVVTPIHGDEGQPDHLTRTG
jgi:uncharacterized protein involved in exopolysaccharide biosynthesis